MTQKGKLGWILFVAAYGCGGTSNEPSAEQQVEENAAELVAPGDSGDLLWSERDARFGGLKGLATDARGELYAGVSSISSSG